jgi:hypothetical protein
MQSRKRVIFLTVFVAGLLVGHGAPVAAQQPPLTAWVARYNAAGNGSDRPTALMHASGNVYVTGSCIGSGTGTDYAGVYPPPLLAFALTAPAGAPTPGYVAHV